MAAAREAREELETRADEWRYLNEGGLNVVFGHRKRESGHVLRVNKEVLQGRGGPHAALFFRRRDYVAELMRPLLGAQFVDAGRVVWLRAALVEALFAACAARRPARRRLAFPEPVVPADPLVPALLVEDYTRCEGAGAGEGEGEEALVFEVKPKWGSLPRCELATPEARRVRERACQFCLLQRVKVARGLQTRPSAYCPLDLFSARRPRVLRAVRALVATPLTNLRVSLGHRAVALGEGAGEGAGAGDDDEAPLPLSALQPLLGAATLEETREALSEAVTEALLAQPAAGLLARLRWLQRELDPWGPEGAALLLARLRELGVSPEEAAARGDSLEARAAIVAAMAAAASPPPPPSAQAIAALDADGAGRALARVLAARTLKDVSVMVAMRRRGGGGAWERRVHVVDLDPKPASRLARYAAEDADTLAQYAADGGAWRCAGEEDEAAARRVP